MLKLLLYIKHKFHFIWDLMEWLNGAVFKWLYYKDIEKCEEVSLSKYGNNGFRYQKIQKHELEKLCAFFEAQSEETYTYFKPHGFDLKSLQKLYKNSSFYMFGVFDQNEIVGYFMIRFFINKNAIVGFFVDPKQQGKGIAKTMGRIMFEICWNNHFKVFATVSKLNLPALKSYKSINNYCIIKEINKEYLFIEFKRENEKY